MATFITITNSEGITLLTITSQNPTVDILTHSPGIRRFTVDADYRLDYNPNITPNRTEFPKCNANINGAVYSSNCIKIIPTDKRLDIDIR